jgi:protein-disulfide isomerase
MSSNEEVARLTVPVSARDHSQGPADAPLTLVEYGDFECPHCGRAHPIIKEVQRRLGSRLRFVFRHFPLAEIHRHANHAAEAAEAAGTHQKFWEMHDALFEHQHQLDDRHLAQYAAGLGLDAQALLDELTSHVHADHVRKDFLSGVRSGVNGTPTFFINGARYDDSWDVETLTAALESAL